MPRLIVSAWDGLALAVELWGEDNGPTPLLCLPGIVRTVRDFAALPGFLRSRPIVAMDYAGRGASARAADPARYAAEACLRDVLDVCAALHLQRAIVIGTSFGGLLAMGLATARPGLLHGVVLNDIGPEIAADGADFVRRFIAIDPALPDLDSAAIYLRDMLPDLSLRGLDEWRQMARLTYAPDQAGIWRPVWDTRIARLLNGRTPDLWALFGAPAHVPLLLLHGGRSNVLRAETVAAMRAARPDMDVTVLPDVDHAPTLSEPAASDALRTFVGRIG